ncbi:glyoxalase [Novosphingobium marinum]|uniref:Catechol 2,3-dioxygenase-like lactoylglutathione lyase family enzyme n=1 Tax=Novosphingobium marinum TaxID=1514948 RepID=A0A7Z0BWE0_9SPHN|nr:VOC family protein [Novosphingobium marinum]NYH96305.1 catechol 2,3-dioxygenase-like lactoylglutathione lyase family enzyme [Novosphingobium marinum]GGC34188.1 glyoxalase [Novosphingobium marinum]
MIAPKNFFQSAWVVRDLDEAVDRWLRTMRVGPFFMMRDVEVEGFRYRGTPGTIRFSAALAQAGSMQIELIQQDGSDPSAYRDSIAEGEEGFHHFGTIVPDYEAELSFYTSQGIAVAADGMFGDMHYAYVDTRDQIGYMTELVEAKESILELFRTVADAAVDWDGRDPIRTP